MRRQLKSRVRFFHSIALVRLPRKRDITVSSVFGLVQMIRSLMLLWISWRKARMDSIHSISWLYLVLVVPEPRSDSLVLCVVLWLSQVVISLNSRLSPTLRKAFQSSNSSSPQTVLVRVSLIQLLRQLKLVILQEDLLISLRMLLSISMTAIQSMVSGVVLSRMAMRSLSILQIELLDAALLMM